jgi:hypothetical protein
MIWPKLFACAIPPEKRYPNILAANQVKTPALIRGFSPGAKIKGRFIVSGILL